jgi:LacI family transcriptional regulator
MLPAKPPSSPSLRTIADRLGISISTVSRIVNGETRRASPALVERVRQVVEETGYTPNHAGRSLRRQETRLVAMLISNLDNPAMAAIAASTETALREAGYVMFLCDTHDTPELQDEYLYAMRSQAVRGYVLVTSVPSPGLESFVASGAPIVFVSRRNPYGPGAFVGIDNRRAGADAADWLLARGITAATVLSPDPGSSVTRDRADGFTARFAEHGRSAGRLVQARPPGTSHLTTGYEAARRLGAGEWPRALFCVSDMLAYGAYRAASEIGIAVPRDCLFLSVDGNPINRWLAPWLASIVVPHKDFGAHILGLLTELWDGADSAERLLPHQYSDA